MFTYYIISITNYYPSMHFLGMYDDNNEIEWFVGRQRPAKLTNALYFECYTQAEEYLQEYISHGYKKKLARCEFKLGIEEIGLSRMPKHIFKK